MSEHNLRYFGLASLTGLTVVGWILDKLPEEITSAVFIAVATVITIDIYKNRNSTG